MKADPARIAILEYELLYVVPKRGSPEEQAVEAAIDAGGLERHKQCLGCWRAFRPNEKWCPDCTDCPEHGNDCSARNRPIERYTCPNYLISRKT